MGRHDEANSRFSKFCERAKNRGVNLVGDTASLRGALFDEIQTVGLQCSFPTGCGRLSQLIRVFHRTAGAY